MRRYLPFALFGVLVAIYAPTWGRSFVSEDFLILRRLGQDGFFATAAESFGGPWLGITLVRFFRPLGSLLLQGELLVFGARPLAFALLHFGVHLLNAALFGRFLLRDDPARPRAQALLAAALFAAYPLHPNTVVFVASFATLFATTFVLLALLAHQDGRRGWSAAAGAAALLCYEQAFFLPLWLLVDVGLRRRDGRDALRSWWPHGLVLVVYLAARQAALSAAVGGYPSFLAGLDPWGLARGAFANLARLAWPSYARTLPGWAPVLAAGLMATLAILAWRRRSEPAARLTSLALAWLLLAPAPFVVVGVVPGNGRYFYLATLGLAMLLLGACRLLAPRRPALPEIALALATVACLALLLPVARAHVQAGDQARDLQAQLRRLDPGRRVFVAGRPTFVFRSGVPIAQVYHWGLADALLPPFTPAPAPAVFVLPELSDAELAPLLARPDLGQVVRWQDGALRPLAALAPPPPLDASWAGKSSVRYARQPGFRYRLILSAAGTPSAVDLGVAHAPGDNETHLDPDLVASMRRLYPGQPIFVWIDARDAAGAVTVASAVLELTP